MNASGTLHLRDYWTLLSSCFATTSLMRCVCVYMSGTLLSPEGCGTRASTHTFLTTAVFTWASLLYLTHTRPPSAAVKTQRHREKDGWSVDCWLFITIIIEKNKQTKKLQRSKFTYSLWCPTSFTFKWIVFLHGGAVLGLVLAMVGVKIINRTAKS